MDMNLVSSIKKIAFSYLDPEDYKVFIFGSRASGTNVKFSDIDLGIEGSGALDSKLILELKEAFEESRLPYKVDVVDFSKTTEKFKNVAMKNTIPLN